MHKQREAGAAGGVAGKGEGKAEQKFAMNVLVDRCVSPGLYSALASAPEGKPRAQRFRELALIGLTLEMLSNGINAVPAGAVDMPSGAEGVFDEPLD